MKATCWEGSTTIRLHNVWAHVASTTLHNVRRVYKRNSSDSFKNKAMKIKTNVEIDFIFHERFLKN